MLQRVITHLDPQAADLHYRGFSVIHQANASSPEIPDYNQLAATTQIWRDLEGYYTRYGDVRELLAATDDRYVIMNAGDEMALRFAAPPPPAAGLGARLRDRRRRLGQGRRLQLHLLAHRAAAALPRAHRIRHTAGHARRRVGLSPSSRRTGRPIRRAMSSPDTVPQCVAQRERRQ